MINLFILLVYMLDHASSDWLPAYSQKKKKKKKKKKNGYLLSWKAHLLILYFRF